MRDRSTRGSAEPQLSGELYPDRPDPAAGSDEPALLGETVGPTTSEQLGLGPELPFTVADRIGLIIERADGWRDRPLVIGGALAVVVAIALLVPRLLPSNQSVLPVEDRIPQVTLTPTSAAAGSSMVVVHVSGAVRAPGVYTLDATARVIDAVDAAGGATGEAQVHLLNLAALIVDGQQIRVPVEGEVVVPSTTVAGGGPVDLNQADVVGLQELPGVGPATAEAIIAHRDENGPFRSVDDLLDVPGIGPAKLAALADAAVVQ